MDEKIVRDFRAIRADYAPDESIFDTDPDKVRRVKWIVEHRLDAAERALILLYAETGSLRKLGARLGVSYGSVKTILDPIKEKILRHYYDMVAAELKQEIRKK